MDSGKSLHPHRWRAGSIIMPRSNETAEKNNRNNEWEVWRRVMVGGRVDVATSLCKWTD